MQKHYCSGNKNLLKECDFKKEDQDYSWWGPTHNCYSIFTIIVQNISLCKDVAIFKYYCHIMTMQAFISLWCIHRISGLLSFLSDISLMPHGLQSIPYEIMRTLWSPFIQEFFHLFLFFLIRYSTARLLIRSYCPEALLIETLDKDRKCGRGR